MGSSRIRMREERGMRIGDTVVHMERGRKVTTRAIEIKEQWLIR